MGKLADQAVKIIVAQLTRHGERIMQECVNERTYEHDTYNLHDSYGYGVYYKGTLHKKGTLAPQAEETRKWYGKSISGSEEINSYLNEYKPSTQGFELVIVAAMPYAEVLENASSGQHRKYKVISMSFDKLKQLQEANASLGATVHRIVRGKLQ